MHNVSAGIKIYRPRQCPHVWYERFLDRTPHRTIYFSPIQQQVATCFKRFLRIGRHPFCDTDSFLKRRRPTLRGYERVGGNLPLRPFHTP